MDINQLAVTVEGIRVQSDNTATAVSKIELGMKDQDGKLDMLVADLNKRTGAAGATSKIGSAVIWLVTVGGGVGAAWAYFHK